MLISGGSTPRLASSICLNPLEKHRLVPDSLMAVHRVKNCCGKINEMYDFQMYFVIQNVNQYETYTADENTSLTQIISHPDIIAHVRVTDSLEKFKAENNFNQQDSGFDKNFSDYQLAHTLALERDKNDDDDDDDDDDDEKDDNNDNQHVLENEEINEIDDLDNSIFEHDHAHDDEQSLCCCVSGDSGNGQWMLMQPFSSPSFYRPFNTTNLANANADTAVVGNTNVKITTHAAAAAAAAAAINDNEDDKINVAIPRVAIVNESQPFKTSYQHIVVSEYLP
jgi:hypothetical protein